MTGAIALAVLLLSASLRRRKQDNTDDLNGGVTADAPKPKRTRRPTVWGLE